MSEKYKIICAWCQKTIVESASDLISHGICQSCKTRVLANEPNNEVDSFIDKVCIEEVFNDDSFLDKVISLQTENNC